MCASMQVFLTPKSKGRSFDRRVDWKQLLEVNHQIKKVDHPLRTRTKKREAKRDLCSYDPTFQALSKNSRVYPKAEQKMRNRTSQ
jgi:hypothetical protein